MGDQTETDFACLQPFIFAYHIITYTVLINKIFAYFLMLLFGKITYFHAILFCRNCLSGKPKMGFFNIIFAYFPMQKILQFPFS